MNCVVVDRAGRYIAEAFGDPTAILMRNPASSLRIHNGGLWRHSVATLFFTAVFVSTRLFHSDPFSGIVFHKHAAQTWRDMDESKQNNEIQNMKPKLDNEIQETETEKKRNEILRFPLTCNTTQPTCPGSYYPSKFPPAQWEPREDPDPSCPEYFRWIHEDLTPWRETGITREMVEMAKQKTTHFRLVVVDGTAYVEKYRKSFHTRDKLTQWGILQLLRRYPGKVPDLDLIFNCADRPLILKESYPKQDATAPPPLFGYDRDDATLDIVFPDWSFWGWPEINIKPWESLLKELKEGNEGSQWEDREPYAYWKGNAVLSPSRMELRKCNVSGNVDWNARIYHQDWRSEVKQGFKSSDLATQCHHRYKIYIEGKGWSVSEKYILACDSVALQVKPRFYDFFTRGLMPLKHYWPIRADDKCRSIKYAVDWGNTHQQEAQAIGKSASNFVQRELQMKYIYDYMFHLLTEYAKLLNYKPSVPPNAIEICSESFACSADGLMKDYMMKTAVTGPPDTGPCTMLPPYDASTLRSVLGRKENSVNQVEMWEKQYWDSHEARRVKVSEQEKNHNKS